MNDENVVRLQNVCKRYGSNLAVKNVNLSVKRGAVLGLLGLNGAGKSTTFRMLLGLVKRSCGFIEIMGLDPEREPEALKRSVGYVGETHHFYEWMTVNEIFRFVANYRKENWDLAFENSLRNRFDLDGSKKMRELSKGMRAKVSLCLAIAFRPDILILDEPTSGLDPVARREFFEGILAEYQAPERTILISSHLINEVSGIVDHVAVLHEGILVKDCSAEDFMAKIKKLRIGFRDQAPSIFKVDGITNYKTSGREATALVLDYKDEETKKSIINKGAAAVEEIDMNLEDAFIEFISAKKFK